MPNPVRILVACGSGVATSTIAQEAVKKIAAEAGINVAIVKGTMNEIESRQNDVDLVLVTTNYKKPLTKPCISVFGLISGIKKDQIAADILAAFRTILAE